MRIIIFYWWATLRCYKLWTISDVIFSGLSSEIYQLGRLRRLIFYMWTTLRCISIGPSPTIDIFSMDYPPIIFLSLDNPPNLFLSRLISCTHSYNPRVFQCIWNACMPVPIQSNHMQIYKHEYTHIIKITQSCYVIIQLIHQN